MTVNWADVLIGVGAVGLVSGLGGQYFFVIPAISYVTQSDGSKMSPQPTSWGMPGGPAFTLDYSENQGKEMPGLPTSFGQALADGISFEFNLPLTVFGMDQWPGWGYGSAGANTATARPFTYKPSGWSVPYNVPGPLGSCPGYLFLALILLGVAMKKRWL
jgi:hypothetical protein